MAKFLLLSLNGGKDELKNEQGRSGHEPYQGEFWNMTK